MVTSNNINISKLYKSAITTIMIILKLKHGYGVRVLWYDVNIADTTSFEDSGPGHG